MVSLLTRHTYIRYFTGSKMAAPKKAHSSTMEAVLSKHTLKKTDLNKECPQALRYDIGIMIVAWKTTKEHFQFHKENLAAKDDCNKIEEERRVALLKSLYNEIKKQPSRATYSEYMTSFNCQERYDLMDSLCHMVKLSQIVDSGSGM